MHVRHWGYSDRRLCCDGCRRLLSSMMRSKDESDWSVMSLIYVVVVCHDYYILFPVLWYSAVYHNGRHGLTMITWDTWRLTIGTEVWWGHWPVAIHTRLFCVLCVKHQASSCSICDVELEGGRGKLCIDKFYYVAWGFSIGTTIGAHSLSNRAKHSMYLHCV